MRSEEGVLSLPLRLAVSMLVVSLALPLCLQSLSDGGRELARAAAVRISEEISKVAEEVSYRPLGESRVLRIAEEMRTLGKSISIVAGNLLGEENYSSVICSDPSGWQHIAPVDLPPVIVGFCSFEMQLFEIGAVPGDILISHRSHPCGEIVQMGFV